MKPGPAIVGRFDQAAAAGSASSAATRRVASSRGFVFSGLASCIAILQAMSPCAGSRGRSSTTFGVQIGAGDDRGEGGLEQGNDLLFLLGEHEECRSVSGAVTSRSSLYWFARSAGIRAPAKATLSRRNASRYNVRLSSHQTNATMTDKRPHALHRPEGRPASRSRPSRRTRNIRPAPASRRRPASAGPSPPSQGAAQPRSEARRQRAGAGHARLRQPRGQGPVLQLDYRPDLQRRFARASPCWARPAPWPRCAPAPRCRRRWPRCSRPGCAAAGARRDPGHRLPRHAPAGPQRGAARPDDEQGAGAADAGRPAGMRAGAARSARGRAEPPYEAFTVVDQAVTAAAAHPDFAHAKAMVNAVLRRFLRERDAAGRERPAASRVAQWNYPQWWIDAAARRLSARLAGHPRGRQRASRR